MRPWRPLLLLFPALHAVGADNDPFSSAGRLDLALPTQAQDLKLGVKVTRWSAIPQARSAPKRPPLLPSRPGNPIIVDILDPMQNMGQNRLVNGVLPHQIAPKEIIGIGLALRIDRATRLPEIVGVMENSPAAAAGLSPGDTIYLIDGANTDGQDLPSLVSLIRGPEGIPVRIQIGRKGQEQPFSVELIRKKIPPKP